MNGHRLHQEDLSQALGAAGNQKYQQIGGVVSLRRVADLLKKHLPTSALTTLARMVVLAVGIGNLDMHTKNIALLHSAAGEVTLAPAYDVVPHAHREASGEMALAVNGGYRHAALTADDLLQEFSSWGVRGPGPLLERALEELAVALEEEIPREGAFPGLRDQTRGFVKNLREGRAVGGPR